MELEDHMEAFEKLCCVCGGNINKYRVKYVCEEHTDSLRITFHLTHQPDVHPRLFCDCCYTMMKHKSTALESNKVYLPSLDLFVWEQHTHAIHEIKLNQLRKEEDQKRVGRIEGNYSLTAVMILLPIPNKSLLKHSIMLISLSHTISLYPLIYLSQI